MAQYLICLVFVLFYFQNASAIESRTSSIYLGSREGDPASIVENVSVVHGDYTEIEVDLVVPAPDSLILSRFYSSRDSLSIANFGGWRLNSHCFLNVQKDQDGGIRAYVGNPDGAILTYTGRPNDCSKRLLCNLDVVTGLANTAKGKISSWTNLKNNVLYFDTQTENIELSLCSEGRRFYSKNRLLNTYLITHEILPSGNKIFYEFDEKGQPTLIKQVNHAETKALAWIKILYGNTTVHVEASDGKTVDYQFVQDPAGTTLLTNVYRSDKPTINYQYKVIDNKALLLGKTLPEGRSTQVDYNAENKVRSVMTPVGSVMFSYEDNSTEVRGPGERKIRYRFNDESQLIAIEQYLDGYLYRTDKKSWCSDLGNLISTSVADADDNILHHKYFAYDSTGNILEEREYGDIAGIGSIPLVVDESGVVLNQKGNLKKYSYFSFEKTYGFLQIDAMGTGVKYWYKKGTNLLLKKFILKGSQDADDENPDTGIQERHFYVYNEDAVLIRTVVDDGNGISLKDTTGVYERKITCIIPKQNLPNFGSPEVIEQRYLDDNSEILLERAVNQFDQSGNVVRQSFYDAKEKLCYTIEKKYIFGQLVEETDPLGKRKSYSYDANQNLILETHSNGICFEYRYDLSNRLVHTLRKDKNGDSTETQTFYDSLGNIISEIDRLGHKTLYVRDSLGRIIHITHEGNERQTYSYSYDLLDNPISVTDPKGRTVHSTYTVHGKPVEIAHLDGTKEVFTYDNGGNLFSYRGSDGLLQTFSYDYKGRLVGLEYFKRDKSPFKEKSYSYGAFHKISEIDEKDDEISYSYDRAGRLVSLSRGNQKTDFIYDDSGRTRGIKTWKSPKTFTLSIKEYDLLDRVMEERLEDQTGEVLLKQRYVYNEGNLEQVIGYPQNKESVLWNFTYDGFGRITRATNAAGHTSFIKYDDGFINDRGQKIWKKTLIDPVGNQAEEIFDENNRLIKRIKKDRGGQTIAESEFSYDCMGNKIGERACIQPEGSYETQWVLNSKDQLESVIRGMGTPEEQTIVYKYNSYEEMITKCNRAYKKPVQYEYNNQGNLETITCKDGKKGIDYTFQYDCHKNITRVEIGDSHEITYSYDSSDRLLTETIEDNFGSYQVDRTYDGEGNIKTLLLPDGSFVKYSYVGPFVKEIKRFSKDKEELYHYQVASRDLMGNILKEILPGKVGERKQSWDKAGRRNEILTDFFHDTVPEGGYDQLDNIKKRKTTLNKKTYIREYDYNALNQLIGEIDHRYRYDSIGNRIQKDNSSYTINGLNHIIEAEGAEYTFDKNGNIATKTIGNKKWTYKSNALNQIITIKDPDHNMIEFTYDQNGKRLNKQIKTKDDKTRISRFFYLGETEIGRIDSKGAIRELKIPSNPNDPESPCIAIELKNETYVPLYDLQGNIVCLIDPQKRRIVETYHYSAFGEEKIFNKEGTEILDTSIGNPWRYRGKRTDKETGLIYFGYRYYDPKVGRWMTPDPLGNIDGPNLYAYVHNNPMQYVDHYGLSATVDENCRCTKHGHPGWYNAPKGCVCICGKAENHSSNIASAIAGISHGVVDFVVGSIHDLQTMMAYAGTSELEMTLQERTHMIEVIEESQTNQMAKVESRMQNMLSIDPADAEYQSFRSNTTFGLNIASLVAGGYGAVKGVMAFNKLAKMPVQASRIATGLLKETSAARKGIKAKQIWTSTKRKSPVQNAFGHWKDHGHEFPELLNSKQYVEHTHNFFAGSRDQLLTKIRPNGEVLLYDVQTNTFGAFTPEGVPKTMFKPTEGIVYWEMRN